MWSGETGLIAIWEHKIQNHLTDNWIQQSMLAPEYRQCLVSEVHKRLRIEINYEFVRTCVIQLAHNLEVALCASSGLLLY